MVISGIIRPPPDIRAVADRTALFVSKNGRAFEIKILNSAKGKTPKFAFLHSSSPFHAYYEDRIVFYNEGGTDEQEKQKEEEEKQKKIKEREELERRKEKEDAEAAAAAARKEAARKKASAVDPIARALLISRSKIEDAKRAAITSSKEKEGEGENNNTAVAAKISGPVPPPTLSNVSLVAPANLSPLEVEVIKLTAQYVALSEQKDSGAAPQKDNFLRNLTLKEWTNPEFQFLQPRHAHFAYFTALVDGYRSFLPGGEEYERVQAKARMDAKKERLANLIQGDNSPSGSNKDDQSTKKDTVQECLETAAYRAEYEREMAERRREAAEGADGMFGGAGTIDWHDFVVVETIEFDADEVVEALPPPTSLRLAALNKESEVDKSAEKKQEVSKEEEEEEEMEESSSDDDVDMGDDDEDDDGGEKLKVVSNYQPKVVSTKEFTGDASRTHIIDPITGKSVAIADMPEHMRIQLLDPKWAEERKRFLDKQRETNFVAGDDIASNISRFAQARGDIFGSSEAEIHDQKVDSEKRLMEANRIIREQMQPQPQPQPQPLPGVPLPQPIGVPPPIQPPIFAPPPPMPPPPPQEITQSTIESEEPAAKRIKVDESETDQNVALAPPPMAPQPPIGMPPPGIAPLVGMAMAPPPPPPPEQPEENEVLSESDFIATLSNPDEVPICIRIPHDPSNSNWNFNGQTIDITLKAMSKIKDLKAMLKEELGGMPTNKMQLKHPSSGFMNKDALSIAHFNIGPMTTLDLIPKTRGGRK